jgi:Holliday junction resolvase RusA-like endonuclease
MTILSFALPVPPSANNLFVNRPGYGRVKSREYKDWIANAGWAAKVATLGKDKPALPYVVSYAVPTDKRRDLDNYLKAANDLLVRLGIIADDSLIDRMEIERAERKDMLVTIGSRA